MQNPCVFCSDDGGEVLYRNHLLRVVLVQDLDYPGFVRVILNNHCREMTDLSDAEALLVFQVVLRVEKVVRQIYNPDKINLASLGNVTPHLHWHIIPRYFKDKHFPNPIWGAVMNPDYVPTRVVLNKTIEFILALKLDFSN